MNVRADEAARRASDHRQMAERLRVTAAKLKTREGRDKLLQLAALYEQISQCYLEGADPGTSLPARAPPGAGRPH